MHCFLKDIITERVCVCMHARACVHACMHTHTTCLKFLGMSSHILPCFRHWAVYSRLGGHLTIPLMLGLQTSASVAGLLREFPKWAKAVKLTPRQVLAPAEPSRSWSCFFLLLPFFPSLPFLLFIFYFYIFWSWNRLCPLVSSFLDEGWTSWVYGWVDQHAQGPVGGL